MNSDRSWNAKPRISVAVKRVVAQALVSRLALITVAAFYGVSSSAYAVCWDAAAHASQVDPVLLKAIAWQESRGRPRAIGPRLPDGNRALGLMQINTIHLPQLKHYGYREADLFDPCKSQHVGARILADCIAQFGAIWRAVGCYYAGPRSKAYAKQNEYVRDVQSHYLGYVSTHQVQAPRLASVAFEFGGGTRP